ncbi:MAG: 6-bladed beta-propeller [Rikenellaceae bacterium]
MRNFHPIRVLFFALSLTMAFACSHTSKEVKSNIINVAGSIGGGRITDISEVVSDIRYIPLETSSVSLVGETQRIFLENDRIYIKDRNYSMSIFDLNGKFITKFCKRGRGPEEYSLGAEIYPAPHSGEILVNSLGESLSILRYNISGRLIGRFDTPKDTNFRTTWPVMLNDNAYVATINIYFNKPVFSSVVYDSLGKTKLLVPIPELAPYKSFDLPEFVLMNKDGALTTVKDESKIKKYSNPDRPFLYKFKDNIRLVYDSNDTVLSIDANMHIDTSYIFNYGEYKNNSMDRSSISATKGKHVSIIGRNKMMETEGFLFMQFALRDYAHEPYEKLRANRKGYYALNDAYAIYNKKSGEFWFLNQTEKGVLGFRENLMGGPPFWPTYVSSDNSVVMIIPAISLIEYAETHKVSSELSEIIKKLKDTDNPVVVIAK